MSSIDYERLKSPADTTIPFLSRAEPFTTAQLIKDTLIQLGKICKVTKVTNLDAGANLTIRLFSPSGQLVTVPPNSEITIPAWTSYIEINPNAVSGNGLLEMDLVESSEAYQKR